MFACIILLILLLPLVFFTATIETFFSSKQLAEMGVCVDTHEQPQPVTKFKQAGGAGNQGNSPVIAMSNPVKNHQAIF